MSPAKSSHDAAPQISISSWLMGGPIVTKPRRARPRPVLVTTELAKPPKGAEEKKANGKKPENAKKEDKKPKEDSSNKIEETKSDATSKGSDTKKSDDERNWTPEQDALLLKLKGKNASWKDIAAQMSLSKSDIRARFKELQKNGAEAPATSTTEKDKGKGGDKDNGKKTERGKTGDGGDGKKADGGAGSGGRLKADDNWSREDCEILEMLEARYREQKWLSMQASFYNLTGRMVRADIIERKLSEASS